MQRHPRCQWYRWGVSTEQNRTLFFSDICISVKKVPQYEFIKQIACLKMLVQLTQSGDVFTSFGLHVPDMYVDEI